MDITEKGSEITFNTKPLRGGMRMIATGTQYDSTLTTTFQICKDPDTHTQANMAITPAEFRSLSRWLNRREFLWFHATDNCAPTQARPYVRASFTLERIDVGGITYGIQLTAQTDSPFAYGAEQSTTLNFRSGALTKTLTDQNDEVGEIFPRVVITCLAAGTITLTNSRTGCSTSVENCANGEVITLSGETMLISSSNVTHKLANDFNYEYFSIGNIYNNRTNSITASMPCDVVVTYRPIIKDTI